MSYGLQFLISMVSDIFCYIKNLTLLHSEWPKLYGVLAILNAIGLTFNCRIMYRELKDGETKADHAKIRESPSSSSIQILSEWEMPRSNDPTACSVDHVLQLLQRLYAIAMEQDTSNKFGKNFLTTCVRFFTGLRWTL